MIRSTFNHHCLIAALLGTGLGAIACEGELAGGGSQTAASSSGSSTNAGDNEKSTVNDRGVILNPDGTPNIGETLDTEEIEELMCPPEVGTIDCFYQAILENNAKSVSDALPLLPEALRSQMMLMEGSESRHAASTTHPRVLLYGDDGTLLVTMSTTPEDPLYEVFELAELQDDGLIKLRALDMTTDPPSLGANDEPCQACHSERVRLIWGQYRTWPGLMGDGDDLAQDDQFVQTMKTTLPERFGSLIANPNRDFGWSGEIFNYLTARTMNIHLTHLMKASPNYTKEARYEFVSLMCQDQRDAYAYLKNFGIEPRDTRSDLLRSQIRDNTEFGYYFGGGDFEDQLAEVALVDLVFLDKDEQLAKILQPYVELYEDVYPLTQEYYDQYNGLLPHDLPTETNGASMFVADIGPSCSPSGDCDDGSKVFAGYGGSYSGFRVWGYGGAWAGDNSYVYRWLYDDAEKRDALTRDGTVHREFCEYMASYSD